MEPVEPNEGASEPVTVIKPLLQNLTKILEEERDHLTSGRVDKLGIFARQKMQALTQINMFVGNDPTHQLAKANSEELGQIRGLLDDNMHRLEFRIKAIGEITETIQAAAKEAESDGTYQPGNFKISKRR